MHHSCTHAWDLGPLWIFFTLESIANINMITLESIANTNMFTLESIANTNIRLLMP